MTPCCQIEFASVSLAPLIQVREAIVVKHPRLHKNLSLINVPFRPEEGFTQEQITKMAPEKQAELLSEGEKYAYLDCFIYEPNELFGAYDVKRGNRTVANISYRMVDFKSIFRVDCSLIERDRPAPPGTKVSELTDTTRSQLRDKLTFYFGQ
jgi:hypothetical protein